MQRLRCIFNTVQIGHLTTAIALSFVRASASLLSMCVRNNLAASDSNCLALHCFKNVLCESRSWIDDRIRLEKSVIVLDSAVQISGTMEREHMIKVPETRHSKAASW